MRWLLPGYATIKCGMKASCSSTEQRGKAKKEMKDPVESLTKNGKPITKGKCPDCGTTICRIGAAK